MPLPMPLPRAPKQRQAKGFKLLYVEKMSSAAAPLLSTGGRYDEAIADNDEQNSTRSNHCHSFCAGNYWQLLLAATPTGSSERDLGTPNEGACLRFLMNRKRQTRGRV